MKKLACLILLFLSCQSARAQHSVTLSWGAGGCPANNPGGFINCNGNPLACNHVTGYNIYRAPLAGGMAGTYAKIGSTTVQVPPNAGDVMYWSGGKWIARTPTTPIAVQSTPISPPNAGDVLMWFNARWVPRTPITPVSRTIVGQILVWNGSAWAPKTPTTPIRKRRKP